MLSAKDIEVLTKDTTLNSVMKTIKVFVSAPIKNVARDLVALVVRRRQSERVREWSEKRRS